MKEVNTVGQNKEKLTELSSTLMEVFVSDVFKKNNVSKETTHSLSEDQKQKIKSVVEDLKKQVDDFLAGNTAEASEEEVKEALEPLAKKTTLREIIRNKKQS
ncbi:hypothetical protein [Litchfieldia salsa]|uniref:Uncharacterized protein n=1 Tax=Litchfieldia salsa TaxID=930152 RepID=A0A1H0S318_9BACI|nr:hypothetical protein [Litchfieldia salsa]SDP36133.1 hypothetical protein SAMN05216565_102518 [Litchfieldia salsa]